MQGAGHPRRDLARRLLFEPSAMSLSPSVRIDRLQRRAAQEPDIIALGGGLPNPNFFPKRDLGDAFFRALHRPNEALQYGWPEGEPELRNWIALRLRALGAPVGPEDIVVTSGAQQAISLLASTLFRPGMSVGMNEESYPGAIEAFRRAGLALVPWQERAAGYYVMPSIGNPGGQPMAPSARDELLSRLLEEKSLLIEDEAYAESCFDGRRERPLLAELPASVVHIGTLSKVLCPGLRVGWIATKHPALQRILAEKQQADLQASSLTQRIVAEYVAGPRFDHHLERIRRGYERKAKVMRAAVLAALPGFRVQRPRGGFSLWLEHVDPEPYIDDLTLLGAAVRHGVSFDPGRSFRIRESKRLAFRLCYGAVEEALIERGVARLAEALSEVRPQQHHRRFSGVSLAGENGRSKNESM